MSGEIVAELARVQALFQARAIAVQLGVPMPDPAAFRRVSDTPTQVNEGDR